MVPTIAMLRAVVQEKFGNTRDARVRRRRKLSSFLSRWLPQIRILLYLAGYLWFLFLPSTLLGRGTYIDENALQPGQVNTYWNWGEVHRADQYLNGLEQLRDTNASNIERAEHMKLEFEKLGLHSATQSYNITIAKETISGVNSYAIFSAPRTSGTEAMVISASWRSRMGEDSLNLRGVATLLALAYHLKCYSHWAKDIIFVVGDDHLPGMQAWLSAYHDDLPSNIQSNQLGLTSGVIWNALNIDYPGHSFSHLGAFHEGLNGRQPNQDLFNSFWIIARHTGGVPVILYDHFDSDDHSYPPSWLPSAVRENPFFLEYSIRARNIARHMYHQASGKGSGVHALYHKYRIDAITIFAPPAQGPHGFYTIGKVIESTLRTMNNLLERLHASFFFYILTTPKTFLKIGHYLPSVILISVATMFGGLRTWVSAGWRKDSESVEESTKANGGSDEWVPRRRPILNPLLVMLATHTLGALLFFVSLKGWALSEGFLTLSLRPSHLVAAAGKFLVLSNVCAWLATCIEPSSPSPDIAPPSLILQSLTLCLASTIVSVISLLNFSLAALLCVTVILPLVSILPSSSDSRQTRDVKHVVVVLWAMIVLNLGVTKGSLWDWNVLGVWFAPFIEIVCVPILLQAAIVCALS